MPKPGTAVHAPTRKRDWLCEGPRVEDGEVTGELVFDEATDLSKRCKKQFEFGSLRMVSAGIDILELSDQPEHLLQGRPARQ